MLLEEQQSLNVRQHQRRVGKKWSALMVAILLRNVRAQYVVQVNGWKKEKENRETDAALHEKKLQRKQKVIDKLKNQIQTLEDIRAEQDEQLIQCNGTIDTNNQINRELKATVQALLKEKKDQAALQTDMQDVVTVLSNRIIVERKRRNSLFIDVSCHIADVLTATTEIQENSNFVGVNRLTIKKNTIKQLPPWCKQLGSSTENVVESDIETIENDLLRLASVCWEQRETMGRQQEQVADLKQKMKTKDEHNLKLKTKLRRVTLAMPTEQRRKIMRKKVCNDPVVAAAAALTVKEQQDVNAMLFHRLVSPNRFATSSWNKLSPL